MFESCSVAQKIRRAVFFMSAALIIREWRALLLRAEIP